MSARSRGVVRRTRVALFAALPLVGRLWLFATLPLVILPALASPAHALVLRDMLGREVSMPGLPSRIVSLVPSVTETTFALGGQDRLIGVSDFCDWPPAARAKPRVGGMINPSLEAIVALRPDLVVGTDEGNREETFLQLQRIGVPVYVVHARKVSEMYELIARVGELTARGDAVASLVADIRHRIDAVRAKVSGRPRPRVLYVVWPDPLLVPGRDSHLTEMIELAGGQSITAQEPVSYVRFSVEAAVARAPEVIVLADHSSGASTAGRAAPEKWQALASVPAIRAGRLYSVDLSILHRYGPRVPDGLEILARLIHPEAFR
jgi:iron complex transport system substrate-binding protein